ncbi:MAG: hypothetical protein V2I66_01625 [Halieaceae bacterium]|jgi:hypothetical protein|nr:hypothetical protein [Halieaceae bacterium]
MKLTYRKEQSGEVSVIQSDDQGESEFSYLNLILSLLGGDELEPPALEGDFSQEEASSIQRMHETINEELSPEEEGSQVDAS